MDVSLAEKSVIFLRKMFLLNLDFQGESQLYANFLIYILIISGKCLAFQYLSRGIRMYFSIPSRVKNGRFDS